MEYSHGSEHRGNSDFSVQIQSDKGDRLLHLPIPAPCNEITTVKLNTQLVYQHLQHYSLSKVHSPQQLPKHSYPIKIIIVSSAVTEGSKISIHITFNLFGHSKIKWGPTMETIFPIRISWDTRIDMNLQPIRRNTDCHHPVEIEIAMRRKIVHNQNIGGRQKFIFISSEREQATRISTSLPTLRSHKTHIFSAIYNLSDTTFSQTLVNQPPVLP